MRREEKPIFRTNSKHISGNFAGFMLWSWLLPILFVASSPTMLQAQYEPTLVQGRSWVLSGFQFFFDERISDSLFINGTIFYGNEEYFVLGSSSFVAQQDTVAFIREDLESGKIWLRQYSEMYGPSGYVSEELLVADYNLEIGDTLNYTFLTYTSGSEPYTSFNVLYTVIDTGQVDGRKYIELNNTVDSVYFDHSLYGVFTGYSYVAINQLPLRFYEGVGPSHGLLFPINREDGYLADPYLHCAYQNDLLFFDDPYVIGCSDGLWLSSESFQTYEMFDIYPNPVIDWLTIKISAFSERKEYDIAIYTSTGHRIYAEKRSANLAEFQLSVNNFEAGLYLIHIRSDDKMYKAKFLKE